MYHAEVTSMKRTLLFILAVVGFSLPASAQVDLSGHWAVRQHEDWQDRGPGPERNR